MLIIDVCYICTLGPWSHGPTSTSINIGCQTYHTRGSSVSRRSSEQPKDFNIQSYYRYSDNISPDVWFEPSEVWEVKGADLTISSVHRAAVGIVDSDKGISLRFPRLLGVREYMTSEQASPSEMVADMYRSQIHAQDVQDEEDDD